MIETITCGTVEIGGTDFDKEVDYEWWDGALDVIAVRAIKIITARSSDVWYDRAGKPRKGRHVEMLDVTAFVDVAEVAAEVADYIGQLQRAA